MVISLLTPYSGTLGHVPKSLSKMKCHPILCLPVYRKLWEWPPTMTSMSGTAAATSRSTSRPAWDNAMIMSTPCPFRFAASSFTVSISSRNFNFSVLDISWSTISCWWLLTALFMTFVYNMKQICTSCSELNHDTWLVNQVSENLKIGSRSKNWT